MNKKSFLFIFLTLAVSPAFCMESTPDAMPTKKNDQTKLYWWISEFNEKPQDAFVHRLEDEKIQAKEVLTIVLNSSCIKDETLEYIGNNFPNLTEISLMNCMEITLNGLFVLAAKCSNLTHLTIHKTFPNIEKFETAYPKITVSFSYDGPMCSDHLTRGQRCMDWEQFD